MHGVVPARTSSHVGPGTIRSAPRACGQAAMTRGSVVGPSTTTRRPGRVGEMTSSGAISCPYLQAEARVCVCVSRGIPVQQPGHCVLSN